MKLLPTKKNSVAVLGTGYSGLALLAYLQEQGFHPTVYDETPPSEQAKSLLSCYGLSVYDPNRQPIREHFIFRSPSIRPDVPYLVRAKAAGAVVWGETEYACALCPCPVIAVSGSDGKTTTATLIARAWEAAGHTAHLGGNIGQSLLPRLSQMRKGDLAVVELSSFQLMDAEIYADTAVITSLSPNHLNWHKDFDEYKAAKRRLPHLSRRAVLRQGVFPDRKAVRFCAQDGIIDGMVTDGGVPLFALSEMRLKGMHNAENYMAAAAALRGRAPRSVFASVARRFNGVPDRMEEVGRWRGIRFYNSSIDTSPARTAVTLHAFAQEGVRPVVLIGGKNKGLSLAPLAEAVRSHAAHAVLFGASAEQTAALFQKEGIAFCCRDTLQQAFVAACDIALALPHPRTVLLSPAFTSFDAFIDYRDRGALFRRLVAQLS